MKQVFKTLVCKAESSEDGTITAVASTPDEDRYGDVVAPSWKLDDFRRSPVIMHAHDYEGPVVGKALEIDVVGDTLMMTVEFDTDETNPLGRRLAQQYKNGFMSAFSVGFAPGKSTERSKLDKDHPSYSEKGGYLLEDNSLLEVSAVAIPANPQALAVRAKRWSLELHQKQAEEAAEVEEQQAEEVTKADPVEVPAPSGFHWMDYEGGPVLMAGDEVDHDGASASFAFEVVDEHDPDRLKDEYKEDEDAEEVDAEEVEAEAYEDEDEEEEDKLRSIVRDELLSLFGAVEDEPVQRGFDLLFADDQPDADGSCDLEALFNQGE